MSPIDLFIYASVTFFVQTFAFITAMAIMALFDRGY